MGVASRVGHGEFKQGQRLDTKPEWGQWASGQPGFGMIIYCSPVGLRCIAHVNCRGE